ncbi:MAG TPA: RNA polymerase subunit sigma-24 [Bacteroidales bacterium]|nr:RNA polymerase subunit sigma-24 [Bacteroidales bacterium]
MNFRRKTKDLSDSQLLKLYKTKGDKRIIGILYKRYTGFTFAVCLRYFKSRVDSEDAVMQIFEKLIDDLKKHTVSNFKSWLYTVAKNHCLITIRNRKNSVTSEYIDNAFVEINSNVHPDDEDLLEQRLDKLERKLSKLSEEQQVCVKLFYIKRQSYAEICTITGYTQNQVKSHIQNGKRKLKIMLTRDE